MSPGPGSARPSAAPLFAFSDAEAVEIAEQHGTPCFAYRLDLAEARFRALRSVLSDRVRLAFAVKANPHPALLARFAELGSAFDCASGGELERVREAGAPGGSILFAGPGKARGELRLALDLGARIQADGPEDLERIEGLLAEEPGAGARAPLSVNLRVHPRGGVSEGEGGRGNIIGGTGPSAFGVDEEELLAFLDAAKAFRGIRISGLQVFAASNELDAGRLLANHRTALAIGRAMAERGFELDCIDLGGGLGIPYAEGAPELDIGALGAGLSKLLAENPWFKGSLILEPGRWLAGPLGVYLARVLRAKESRGKRFLVLEGGINHLIRPLLTGQAFPAKAPGAAGAAVPQVLAGPLCTSLDRLGELPLPPLRAGDLVMLGQAGAYGFTEAMGAFLSHPAPAEHWFEGPPSPSGHQQSS
ncbi:MAG TPA: hypothetical protein VFL04_04500 [Rectinemataceae bacterium]|nr:hypothetical protein [Rectinemataceae bacterium]